MSKLVENNLYNIMDTEEPGRDYTVREPTVGRWYTGITRDNTCNAEVEHTQARYDGDGKWYSPEQDDVDMYLFDYLHQEIA